MSFMPNVTTGICGIRCIFYAVAAVVLAPARLLKVLRQQTARKEKEKIKRQVRAHGINRESEPVFFIIFQRLAGWAFLWISLFSLNYYLCYAVIILKSISHLQSYLSQSISYRHLLMMLQYDKLYFYQGSKIDHGTHLYYRP